MFCKPSSKEVTKGPQKTTWNANLWQICARMHACASFVGTFGSKNSGSRTAYQLTCSTNAERRMSLVKAAVLSHFATRCKAMTEVTKPSCFSVRLLIPRIASGSSDVSCCRIRSLGRELQRLPCPAPRKLVEVGLWLVSLLVIPELLSGGAEADLPPM